MATARARLDRLETIWRRDGEATDPRVAEFEASAEVPAEVPALRWAAKEKARRHYVAESGWSFAPDAWPNDPRWYHCEGHKHWPPHPDRPDFAFVLGVEDDPRFAERVRRELADLARLTETLGAEAAIAAWLAEADALPPAPWQARSTAEGYARELAHEREMLDRLRAAPELAGWRARTGWRLDMDEAEAAAFGARLAATRPAV
jgi:hypothetical protein